MSRDHDNPSSILFDIVDLFERDRRSGSLLGLAHYLARFPGHEEDVAREYLQLLDPPRPDAVVSSPPEPSAPSAGSAPPQQDSASDFLQSSGTSFGERLRRLAAPIIRGTHFQREEELARGGMGVIHRVRDVELDRTLALKEMILGPAYEHAMAAARFLEEAQVTAQLDHPGIVPIHEVGLNAEGHLYFAMKLVRGRDLRTILELSREGREGWTQPRMLGVLLKVCEAMAYAHTKGVIHRDLKPGNVMVGHFGEVYVMDWGLARAMGRADVHDIRLELGDETQSLRTERRDEREETPDSPLVTMDGAVVGTPAYRSPEQARGEIQLLSPRSDVYSIGAMLYHLLTGQTPFVPSGARLSKHTVLARVIEGPPRPMQELAPDASVELQAICEKAMAREPERRYQDTRALAEDLRSYLEGRVVQAHETGGIAELKKWVGRNKALAVASAAAIAALLAGFATSFSLSVRAAEKTSEVLRLSALQELDDLLTEADALWPVLPEGTGALERWLGRARRLLAELPGHERKLVELEQGDAEGDRWWRNQLGKLVEGLRELAHPERGLISGVSPTHGWGIEGRLAFARTVRDKSLEGEEASARWAEAAKSIRDRAECPMYQGLAPQLGLLPIGRDPSSGLWEFAHLQSGEPAQRDGAERLLLSKGVGIVLVLIPGGTHWMGAQRDDRTARNYSRWANSREAPVHEVALAPYFISKYEVTQDQWARFVGNNPSEFTPENPHSRSNELAPVEQVSWTDCDAFTLKQGLALPSEEQWEYAARAGTGTIWWTGDEAENLRGAANLADSSLYQDWSFPHEEWDDGAAYTAMVGSYVANPFGLHDVHGNVEEWCSDPWNPYRASNQPAGGDPSTAEAPTTRMSRGGSFLREAWSTTSARRVDSTPDTRSNTTGLRPARAITAE